MMHCTDFTRRRVQFEIRKCGSLGKPTWMNYRQENPISYEHKRSRKSVLQWRFSCTGRKRLLHQNEENFRWVWNEPDKRQPYGLMLIRRRKLSDCSTKSITWHLLNGSFSINYSNIIRDHYGWKSGLRQLVTEAYSPKDLLRWWLLQKKRLTGR